MRTVRDNPLQVLLMACAGLYVTCHSTTFFLWASLGAAIVLTPAVYGRFAQVLSGERPGPLLRLFARHGCNFYAVIALFFVPLVVASFWVRRDLATVFLNTGFAAAQILLIYVLPASFVTGSPVEAVTRGLAFLKKNALPSLPLIGLALVNPVLHLAVPSAWTALDLSSLRAAALTLPFALLYTIAASSVSLTLFVAAGMTMLGRVQEATGGSA